ncbi:MAG: ABC transporter permease subunit [Anaerolineales bacterium]|nr:ABC transporter permease subunit [Anaerolineales bacterium]
MTTATLELRKQRGISWHRKRELEGYLFSLPWIIGIFFFFLYPMGYAAYISFTDWRVTGVSPWVGLLNYQRLFNDPLFFHSLKLTTRYTLISVPLQLIFGFTMAYLLNQKIRGVSIFRTIYYMPAILSGPAIAIVWRWLFNTEFGIFNFILKSLGIINESIPWLTSRDMVFWFFIIMSLWMVGYTVVLYLAGLQGIPTEYYEAADVDGANGLQKLWFITIPQLSPVIFYTLLTTVVASFQVFTVAYIVSSGTGGPANGSLFYYLYLYQSGFQYGYLGYAAAMGWILFAILTVISIFLFRFSRSHVYYEARQGEGGA